MLSGSSRRLSFALTLTALALLLSGRVMAQDRALPPELAVVPQDAFVFVFLRPAELWNGEPIAGLRKLNPQFPGEFLKSLGQNSAETESFIVVFPRQAEASPKETDHSDPIEKMVYIETTFKPFSRDEVLQRVLGKTALEKKHQGKTYFESGPGASFFQKGAVHFINDKTYLYTMSSAVMKKTLDGLDQRRTTTPLSPALNLAAKKHQLVVGVNLDDPIWQAQKKLLSQEMAEPEQRFDLLDPTFPTWMLKPLLETKSAAATLDLGKEGKVKAQVFLSFPDPERAGTALTSLQDILALGRIFTVGRSIHQLAPEMARPESRQEVMFLALMLKQAETALRGAAFDRRQASVRIHAEGQFDVDYLRGKAKIAAENYVPPPSTVVVKKLDDRTQSINNLKQMMLAMHSFHDAYKTFPGPAICGKDGTPLLSWRVAILPYLGEDVLYRQFKLDEPWDSPNNIKLLAKMPKVYAPIGVKTKEPYTTFYQVVSGPDTAFELIPDMKAPFGARGMRLGADFVDGTSNTIGIVEASDPVPWTKPADVVFDAKKPLPRLGGTLSPTGFYCALCDGSVRFVRPAPPGMTPFQASERRMVSEETLRYAIIRNDGMPFGPDW